MRYSDSTSLPSGGHLFLHQSGVWATLRRRAAAPLATMAVATAVIGTLVGALSGAGFGPGRHAVVAGADVVRHGGFQATVDGHRGWFGSYALPGIGTVWCVDHGPAAPDADHGYVPSELAGTPEAARTAMAWALGRNGKDPDPVTAAALTLVLHDLMQARYPTGPLDVDRLTTARLAGFDGLEERLLARARAIKADSVAHGHLRPPLSLLAHADPVGPGQQGVLVARLTDGVGAPVPGVSLSAHANGEVLGPGTGATDGRGEQRFPFVAARGANRLQASGTVPDLRLHSLAPTVKRAQRVARAAHVPVSAATGFAAPGRRLAIRKTVDLAPYLPPAGARFQVRRLGGGTHDPPVGELVSGVDGRTPSLELDPGDYEVVEVAAPPGYARAGPWRADLTSTDLLLEAHDTALPGAARITKVDVVTGRPLAGATLALAYDADHDGRFETGLGQMTSGAGPEVRELRPGDYELRETAAPRGYRLNERPVRFSVAPGRVSPVEVANAPLAPAAATRAGRPTGPAPTRAGPVPVGRRPGRLPSTGRPLSDVAPTGFALATVGFLLVAVSGGPARKARRRARRLQPAAPMAPLVGGHRPARAGWSVPR